MTILTIVLIVKIGVTLFAVVLPFLVFSKEKLNLLLQMKAESPSLYRLYGVAVLALLVGYGSGIHQIVQDIYPSGIIAMGITSNAGAALVLFLMGAAKRNKFLTVFFTLIAVCLIGAALNPEAAMTALSS
jgi:hypothetical protein